MRNVIVVLALFIIACNRPAKVKNDEIGLNAEKIKINVLDTATRYIEDIADTTHLVTLSAPHYFTFSPVSNFFFTDSAMIVADRMQSVVFIFNRQGQLTATITGAPDKKKMNDGRFTYISDAFYDDNEKLIEILDRTADRVFRFTANGAIKDTLKLGDARAWGYEFVKVKDTYFTKMLNNNEDKKGLGIYKRDGKVLRYNAEKLSVIPSAKYLNIVIPHQLETFQDSAYYFPMLENKIYRLADNEAKPAYVLDYPAEYHLTKNVSEAMPTKDYNDYYKRLVKSNILYSNRSLFINDKWVTFRFNFQSKTIQRSVFYNKKTKKVLQYANLKSKTGNNPFPLASVVGKYKSYFVMLNDAPMRKSRNPKVPPVGSYKLMFFKLKNI